MNIEKNNSPLKFADIKENDKQKVEKILKRVEGLYNLLDETVRQVDKAQLLEEDLSPRIKEIAKHMTDDKNVEEAVMFFLSYGGKGYRIHEKGAIIIKKDLEKELKCLKEK